MASEDTMGQAPPENKGARGADPSAESAYRAAAVQRPLFLCLQPGTALGETGKKRALTTGNKRAPLSQRGQDLYETPEEATEALLRVEHIPGVIWEPASGPGAIVRVLRRHARMVYATDLINYDSRDQDQSGRDFLLERRLPRGAQAIITNPPFKLAEQFVAHALELCPLVMMLLRLAFLESERRTPILDNGKLARVHIFKKRLPMMHRAGWDGPKASSGMGFAWFIWDAAHKGPAEVDRISWDRTGGRP